MLPTYRLARSFGAIQVLDEAGLCIAQESHSHGAAEPVDSSEPFLVDEAGQVIGFRMPDGTEATEEQIKADAAQYATCFARDARACHVQNHDHDCTSTCFKYN